MNRFIFPLIAAALIIFGIYWFTMDRPPAPQTAADLFGYSTSTPNTGTGQVNVPSTNQPHQSTNPDTIMKATLKTNKGDIVIELNPNTPNTTANFVKLAKAGFYDGTKFHRVIEGFMNQGGDPLSKNDAIANQWGTGGPGYQFADEIGPNNSNAAGTISMANAGPNTNGSQFFINVADNNFLDPKHTVFGKVVTGMDVVMAINTADTDANDRPLSPIVIQSIVLE